MSAVDVDKAVDSVKIADEVSNWVGSCGVVSIKVNSLETDVRDDESAIAVSSSVAAESVMVEEVDGTTELAISVDELNADDAKVDPDSAVKAVSMTDTVSAASAVSVADASDCCVVAASRPSIDDVVKGRLEERRVVIMDDVEASRSVDDAEEASASDVESRLERDATSVPASIDEDSIVDVVVSGTSDGKTDAKTVLAL